MKKIIITLLLVTFVSLIKAQQALTLYNMDVIGQSNQVNPSLMPESNMYIGIPMLSSTTFLFTNSGFTWRDLHWIRPDDSVNIDIANAISKLSEKNFISMSFRTNILETGFRIKNNYFSMNVSEKMNLNFTFPKELFELLFNGNGAFIGQEIDLKRMSFEATHYREYAIGWVRALNKKVTIRHNDIPKYPAVQRDLAIVVDKSLPYETIEKATTNAGVNKLTTINLFDVFESEKLGVGKKSMAISFTFLDTEKTLTDKEIDGMMNKIIGAYETELKAEIRK